MIVSFIFQSHQRRLEEITRYSFSNYSIGRDITFCG